MFASFIARDSTFDVFINVWRQAHSRSPSVYGGDDEVTESPVNMVNDGKTGAAAASNAKPKSTQGPTKCACGEKGEHYAEKAMEAVFPSTPESIYNLMFPSQFIREFMSDNQKLTGTLVVAWHRISRSKLTNCFCDRHPNVRLDAQRTWLKVAETPL